MPRAEDELPIHDDDDTGRSFEWYWDAADEMPGQDGYDALSDEDSEAFLSVVYGWGALKHGVKPARSQVNVESKDPLILAIKAGKMRFPVFQKEGEDTWVVCGPPYKKEGQKRDKTGDRCIARAIKQLKDFEERVSRGEYYDR